MISRAPPDFAFTPVDTPAPVPAPAPWCSSLPPRPLSRPSVGSGRPGPLDGPSGNRQGQQIEQALRPQSLAFVEQLRRLSIPVRFEAYDPGTHDWPYWQRELHRSLPLLLAL